MAASAAASAQLAADVYRAARDGRRLMAQAPTGIGKTIGTLFPMLRACGDGYLDRVLFLTAKTPGRALALDALALLRAAHEGAAAGSPVGGASASAAASRAESPPGGASSEAAADLPSEASSLGAAADLPSEASSPEAAADSSSGTSSPEAPADSSSEAAQPESSPDAQAEAAPSAAVPGAAPLPLRVLELVARDKACEHPDKACHGESCPLARGFYDRLPAARAAQALALRTLDQARLREVALAHRVCPYYLAQELARWSDVVVGDYNYYYDGSALLHSLAVQNQWRVGGAGGRGAQPARPRPRGMYSATLDQFVLADAKRHAPPTLAAPLEKLNREWNALNREQDAAYLVMDTVPSALLLAAQRFIGRVSEVLADAPLSIEPNVLQFAFDAMHFVNLAEQFDTHSIFDVTRVEGEAARQRGSRGGRAKSVLCVRNVIPADFLAPRHALPRAPPCCSRAR